jgi:outer membrane immunogenic protein
MRAGSVPVGALRSSDIFGGGQLGYNVQAGNFVYGIEADFGFLGSRTKGVFTDAGNPLRVVHVSADTGFYSDVTGRAGLTLGNALIYAKGGLALFTGGIHVADAFDSLFQNSGTFTGWTVGGGVEYMIAPNFSLKAEYQYFDFDNSNFSCCLISTAGRLDNNITANTLKVGFNYQIHSVHNPLN